MRERRRFPFPGFHVSRSDCGGGQEEDGGDHGTIKLPSYGSVECWCQQDLSRTLEGFSFHLFISILLTLSIQCVVTRVKIFRLQFQVYKCAIYILRVSALLWQ